MSWNPTIEIATANGVREVRLQSKLLQEGKIFLNGEITSQSADEIISQLLYLNSEGIQPTLFINSPGGSVNSGLSIVDVVESFPEGVTMVVTGIAASMAAVIFSCGKKRFILPHAEVMIHEPLLINECSGGNASSFQRKTDKLLSTRDIISGILARNTGHSLDDINRTIEYDYYMNAQEAVSFGIADSVLPNIFSL